MKELKDCIGEDDDCQNCFIKYDKLPDANRPIEYRYCALWRIDEKTQEIICGCEPEYAPIIVLEPAVMIKDPSVKYWDVELWKRKSFDKVTKFINENGGEVTDKFDHEGSGIYMMRVRMDKRVAQELRRWKEVRDVCCPPRLTGMSCARHGE